MILGIVGSEEAKFTEYTKVLAYDLIQDFMESADLVVSGGCHLGGIDKWAVEIARSYGIPTKEHLPANLQWSTGYKPRNMKIAEDSDRVICITVKDFPPDYKGLRFPYCYHCLTDSHIKSGGCWTVKYAKKIGKEGLIYAVG